MPTANHRQPFCRFLTFIRFIFFADLVVSSALWLAGGDSQYLEDNVTEFQMNHSVFDLALIHFLLAVSFIALYTEIESLTMQAIAGDDESGKIKSKKKFYMLLTFVFSVASLAYSIAKCVFIVQEHNDHPKTIHSTYYALTISSMVFSGVEFLMFFVTITVLKKTSLRYTRMNEADVEGKSDGKKKADLGRLFSLAKPEIWLLFFGTLGLIVSSGSNMVAPLFFGKVIDAALKPTMGPLNKTIIILFGIYAAGGFAAFFRSWLYTLAGQRLVARLRKKLFTHILYQEIAFFDTNRTGELMNRLSSDSQVIQNAVTVNISMLVRYFLQIIGSLAIMFAVSPKLTGVLLAVVPIVAIGAQRYGAFVRDMTKKFQDKLADASTAAEESIGNVRTVKSFSQEKKAANLYGDNIENSYQVGSTLAFASGAWNATMAIFAQGAIVLVLWYGGKLVHIGNMTVGTLTSFMLYTLNVAMAFAFLSSLYGDFMKAVGASTRIFELFDREAEIKSGSASMPSLQGAELVFNDVTFRYPTRPETDVLKGISFSLKPGETVALVGPSGGGKSTIISMIERFYDPVEGNICIGNLRLPDVDLDWLRTQISIVNQEPVLFATTIAENIAYGKDATEQEIVEAAKQANAHDFISAFEDGYKTTVGERGIKLSGGQKQRVAIARALLLNPDILLLDEATSALDAESEHLVKEAIDRAMIGRTVLVIAHRLSTVRNADKVIVIEHGSIVEQGTHDELIQKEGTYMKLVARQLQAGELNDMGLAGTGNTPKVTPTLPRRKVEDTNAKGAAGDSENEVHV